MGFGGRDDASDLTAEIVDTGANQQHVVISGGGVVVDRVSVPL